jgi:hypothetical protein
MPFFNERSKPRAAMVPILETRALAQIPHETWVVAPSVEQFVGSLVLSESKREAGDPGDWYSGDAWAGRLLGPEMFRQTLLSPWWEP